LFRDAQNKLPEVVNKDYIQMLSTDYAKVYDPESMTTEELRKEEMRQAIIETQEQMDKDLKDALGADFETKIGTLSQ
jgi:membrane glycosyltransferase